MWKVQCLELSKLLYFVLAFIVVYISQNERYKCIYRAIINFPRDIDLVVKIGHMMLLIFYYDFRGWTTLDIFLNHVKKTPQKTAFICGENSIKYKEMDEFSNRAARFYCSIGLAKGDSVAIFLETRVEYPSVWIGLMKIGGVGALINTNQRTQVLEHSLKISGAKYLIYGTELTQALKDIKESLRGYDLYHIGTGEALEGSKNYLEEISKFSPKPLENPLKMKITDKFLYIYTSGTTGLPKAAIMTHARYWVLVLACIKCFRLKGSDIVYDPLPLYHTAGGLLGVGQVLMNGSTVVLRPKFSASNFWIDCIKYNCTAAQYIGEMCRYLLSQPPKPTDRHHKVRCVFGNGLKFQVWEPFVNRFGIEQIGEYYGATEGNAAVINAWNFPGACGYIPWFAKPFYPISLIKVDETTNEPIRGPDGLCIECKIGEPGLLVGKIQKRPTGHFNGYVDKEATEKKILRDVCSKGDKVFNSGDILVKDEWGYVYFKDRTGDTFRWRGENVATTEVEAIISNIVGLKDATVYGVELPDVEGRAGMAAIVDTEGRLDLEKLSDGIHRDLPPYARPVFIRIIHSIPITSTFKIQKVNLQKEGYNVDKISDPLYVFDAKSSKYIPFTRELYNDVLSNKLRL
ncbi:long-chain fatty acid transport protein 4 [Halyomorpha halys]|uniref:long-chain fatty acid transport protein 4 n=1 Tax=Halyomorpha halys TaxID=286706 RepID=UPI0006D51B04